MKSLSALIDDHEEMLHELSRTLLHEDELVDYGMVQKHYDSLTRGSRNNGAKKRESVIPQWLGLPVEPADPYQEGRIFSQYRRSKNITRFDFLLFWQVEGNVFFVLTQVWGNPKNFNIAALFLKIHLSTDLFKQSKL